MSEGLISLQEIKQFLRIDGEEEDTLLATFLTVAKEHCENYLQVPLETELPSPVKHAMLLLVRHFYDERSGEEIPKVVYALLTPYRASRW